MPYRTQETQANNVHIYVTNTYSCDIFIYFIHLLLFLCDLFKFYMLFLITWFIFFFFVLYGFLLCSFCFSLQGRILEGILPTIQEVLSKFKRQWLADEKQMRFILWLYAVRNSGSLSRAQSQTYLVRRPPPFLPTTPNPTPTPELTNNVSSSEGNISFYIS